MLKGRIGSRDGSAIVGAIRETRRVVMDAQKIGPNRHVLDAPGADQEDGFAGPPPGSFGAPAPRESPPDDPLLAEERALTERLEKIREQRSGSRAS